MPNVTRYVDEQRVAFGKAFVDDCIKRGVGGEPNRFYAFEGGHVLGTPFTADAELSKAIRLAVVFGGKFAVAIARPEPTNGAA
jgi:hypothetical protein